MRTPALICLLCFCADSSAVDHAEKQVHWYKVVVKGLKSGTIDYYGSSELDAAQMKAAVSDEKFLCLENLEYENEAVYRTWKEWDGDLEGSMLIRCERILDVRPLVGDPIQRNGKRDADLWVKEMKEDAEKDKAKEGKKAGGDSDM